MCGIVGYCGPKQASEILLEGLKRLEYRGYDSAGICVGENDSLTTVKCKGKIRDLRSIVPVGQKGKFGIGHTRWATHGEVNDENAHPHGDGAGRLSIVHNGIIENYVVLKEKLQSQGHVFKSDTDSEVIAHLVSSFYSGDLEKAVRQAAPLLTGTYGIACVHADEPDVIVGARNGSPLVLGIGNGEMFLASDVTAIMSYTRQVVYLEDGEIVRLDPGGYRTSDVSDRAIEKKIEHIDWDLQEIEKGDFPTFMEKEIFEQPLSVERAMKGRLDKELATGHLGGLNMSKRELLDVERVKLVATGTSYYAAMVAAYMLETTARIPSTAELASELRYKNPVVERNTLHFVISQSGETADTLFAMRELQRKGARVLGICNVVGSTIPRESDGGVYIHSGPEIAVASTKAFTSQLTALYLFTLIMARMRHLSFEAGLQILESIEMLPGLLSQVLSTADEIKAVAKKYCGYSNFLFLGRGLNYPVALEGALKLKEISYIHAEGCSAAEMKHGLIALVNEETPSMFLVPDDRLRDKVISNMKEVKARRGKIIALAANGNHDVDEIADDIIYVPTAEDMLYPFLMVVPLQLFAYYCARELGRDVDQPRNLAKSVTVE